ncbi:HAD hydrolase family protein, partial [Chromobacterium amazonense]|uniref:HAD hydrolase family protein n=1 Tax=Chromobacterium amazonense TaxID=1382803 RepID=UPI0031F6A06D
MQRRQPGKVVGFLGDGINDAPALRAADIGISVDSAVDIAKEAADIILLEKNLMVLEEGVIQGRRTFNNSAKQVRSKIELIGPKNTMKRPMSAGFHFSGLRTSSSSTLSNGMV